MTMDTTAMPTPSPPHSDDSTIPSSSVETIIHQHQPSAAAVAAASTAPLPITRTPPTPSARQQVPAPDSADLRAPPLPADADTTDFSANNRLLYEQQHLYNTPSFPNGGGGDSVSGSGGSGAEKSKKLTKDPNDDVEIFSSQPIIVHVPKKPPKNASGKDSASASSSITLLTGADAGAGDANLGGAGAAGPAGGKLPGRRTDGQRASVLCVWLAVGQLLCSVALTAIGVLMWTRGATFAHGAAGLWAGAVCGVAGALGVINERKARTGFLAVCLICVATSTLAMALTGIGLVRDMNANENRGAVTAAAGLLATLAVHFFISVLAVYYAALQQCSSRRHHDHLPHLQHLPFGHPHPMPPGSQLGDNLVYATGGSFAPGSAPTAAGSPATGTTGTAGPTNPAHLSRQRVEQYFRSLPRDATAAAAGGHHHQHHHHHQQQKQLMQQHMAKAKAASELYGTSQSLSKMPIPVWTSATGKPHFGTLQPAQQHRPAPVMLVPAGLNANMLPIYHPGARHAPPPQLLYPPHLAPPGMLPYHPHHTMRHPHHPQPHHGHHPHHPHHLQQHPYPPYSASTVDAALLHPGDKSHRMRPSNGGKGGGKNAARRRKSESDRNNGGVSNAAFVYHGLDRAIADSFLEQQERQNGSIECTSLSGRGADVAM